MVCVDSRGEGEETKTFGNDCTQQLDGSGTFASQLTSQETQNTAQHYYGYFPSEMLGNWKEERGELD